jgi:hypothetical protein
MQTAQIYSLVEVHIVHDTMLGRGFAGEHSAPRADLGLAEASDFGVVLDTLHECARGGGLGELEFLGGRHLAVVRE